jgi:NADPH-dependent 2,4-dienoyl-CoA reductase/sulfur reductase-like enzyme
VINTLDEVDTEQADLRGGRSPWFMTGRLHIFSSVSENTRCDALIGGGGITGSLIAERLTRQGLDVAVIESVPPRQA